MSEKEKNRVQEFWDLMIDEVTDGNKAEFSRLIKMSPQSFQNYYNGDRKPGWDILKRILALGYSLNAFCGGIGPIRIIQMDDNTDTTIDLNNEKLTEGSEYKKDQAAEPPGPNFFAHINEADLSQTERALLAEAKQFSDFLKNLHVPLQVKRLMLELMIEHIGQEIQRLQSNPS